MLELFAMNAVRVWIFMTAVFCIALIRRRNDLADVAWGLGFLVVIYSALLSVDGIHGRGLLVGLLVTIWGVRLSVHIASRNKNKKEDFRYAAWRKVWGRWFIIRSYVQVSLLQGFILLLVSLPAVVGIVAYPVVGYEWLIPFGLAVWLIGFFFESIGDLQLALFLEHPENDGKIMTHGLWSWTRHPNYFGEVTQWWGIFLIALSSPSLWYISLIGPLMITFLILKVSGIPMLEAKYKGNAEFEAYRKKTNAFFPFPSRF